MRVWRRSGMGALLLLAATGFPVLAEAEPERIRIQITAPKGCADEVAFLRALRKRTGRFQLGSGTEQARTFVATVAQAGLSVSGRLEIRGPGTQVSVRNVSGRNCEEVVAALAFMTALVIDTNAPAEPGPAKSAPAQAEASRTPPPSSTPANGVLPPPGPVASAVSLAAAAPAAASPAAPSPSERQEEEQPRIARSPDLGPPSPPRVQSVTTPPTPGPPRWKWAAGAAGQVSFVVSPTVGAGGLLFVETAAPGASGLGPVVRAGLFVSQSDVTVASGAGARFQWAGSLVEGCPVRFAVAEARLALHPCLSLHLGVLRGEGRALDQPRRTTDFWADLGPLARIRLAISARLFLEIEGMLVVPLRRLTFDVQDQGPAQAPTTVFKVPVLGALAGMGVAYEFR